MSVEIFELKEVHITLLKNLRWGVNQGIISNQANDGEELAPPFGFDSIYEAFDLIINGKPEGIDILSADSLPSYSEERKAEWDVLYSELPKALEIILQTGRFEVGIYKTKWHIRNWEKIK